MIYLWKDCEIIITYKITRYSYYDFTWISFLYNRKYNKITFDFFGYDTQFYEGSYLENIIVYGEELPYDEYCDDEIIGRPIYSPKEFLEKCKKRDIIEKRSDIPSEWYNDYIELYNEIHSKIHNDYIKWYNNKFNIEK